MCVCRCWRVARRTTGKGVDLRVRIIVSGVLRLRCSASQKPSCSGSPLLVGAADLVIIFLGFSKKLNFSECAKKCGDGPSKKISIRFVSLPFEKLLLSRAGWRHGLSLVMWSDGWRLRGGLQPQLLSLRETSAIW